MVSVQLMHLGDLTESGVSGVHCNWPEGGQGGATGETVDQHTLRPWGQKPAELQQKNRQD